MAGSGLKEGDEAGGEQHNSEPAGSRWQSHGEALTRDKLLGNSHEELS
jgi:hypothetical protein